MHKLPDIETDDDDDDDDDWSDSAHSGDANRRTILCMYVCTILGADNNNINNKICCLATRYSQTNHQFRSIRYSVDSSQSAS